MEPLPVGLEGWNHCNYNLHRLGPDAPGLSGLLNSGTRPPGVLGVSDVVAQIHDLAYFRYTYNTYLGLFQERT